MRGPGIVGYERLGDIIHMADHNRKTMHDLGRECVCCGDLLGPWNETGWCRPCRNRRDGERKAQRAMELQPSPTNFCNWGGFRTR